MKLNQNLQHVRKSDLKMHVQNLGYPFPYKLGVQQSSIFDIFQRLRNLTAIFNG